MLPEAPGQTRPDCISLRKSLIDIDGLSLRNLSVGRIKRGRSFVYVLMPADFDRLPDLKASKEVGVCSFETHPYRIAGFPLFSDCRFRRYPARMRRQALSRARLCEKGQFMRFRFDTMRTAIGIGVLILMTSCGGVAANIAAYTLTRLEKSTSLTLATYKQ